MKRANPAVIGGFIVGAVVLAIAGVMILGSGKLFTETIKCVMYFEGAIQGLYVGAPVNFRGVKVGSVTSIKMQFDRQNFAIRIPVIVEFPEGTGGPMEMLHAAPRALKDALAALIERGLRAQLQTDSLVTGQLFIQLDLPPAMSPEAAPKEATFDPATKLLEIPTVPTTLQEVSNTVRRVFDKLAELPLEEMLRSFEGTLLGINRLVNAPELQEAIHNLNVTLTGMQQVLQQADTQVTHVASSATTALESLNKAATDIHQLAQQTQQLVQHVDKQLGQVASSATTTLGQVGKLTQTVNAQALALATSLSQTAEGALHAIERMRETLTAAQQLVTPSAPVGYELVKTLREFSETARSLRVLANYLERHPNALVFGRQESGTK
jgi:phospholipid/cholesterol/gamma-HCH transport system substrate-binding protein